VSSPASWSIDVQETGSKSLPFLRPWKRQETSPAYGVRRGKVSPWRLYEQGN
jgi:hypothetical protein